MAPGHEEEFHLIGELLGHYRIKSAIGAGGMGEVFRATDTTLGREVALKVLPAEMASNPERLDRFKREAKALAALDHPAVVGVYSVEESNGIHFLTMQLVEGQTLEPLIVHQRKTFGVRLFLSWDCPWLRNMESDPRYQELKRRVLATKLQS